MPRTRNVSGPIVPNGTVIVILSHLYPEATLGELDKIIRAVRDEGIEFVYVGTGR